MYGFVHIVHIWLNWMQNKRSKKVPTETIGYLTKEEAQKKADEFTKDCNIPTYVEFIYNRWQVCLGESKQK